MDFYMVILFLIFWGINTYTYTMPTMAVVPFYIPTNSAQMFPFLYILDKIYFLFSFSFLFFFDNKNPTGCKVVSHCHFSLHFFNGLWCWASFHVLFGHLYVSLEEMSIQVFCSLFFTRLSDFCCCLIGIFNYSRF